MKNSYLDIAPPSSPDAWVMRVLVVDDEKSNRVILRAFLEKEGYTVWEAVNGRESVEIFKDKRPDLVLMDVMMPEMDGYEATRAIKAEAGNKFVPVIFLTAASDEAALAKCIACGGDDFLTKPYSRVIIQAKILALWRVKALTTELYRQNEQLELHHQRLQTEHEFAERIFTKIVKSKQFTTDGIRMHIAPMGIASGDLVLAAKHPIDGRYIMMGDFTGHGLSAALGAIPVSDIFYSMASKGLNLSMIVDEINKKLCEKLPTGFFMAACFMYIRDSDGGVEVWAGGVPDILLVGPYGKIKQRVHSKHLPVGVDKNASEIGAVETVQMECGDRIYIYSDGVTDLRDANGEMFGADRLNAILGCGRAAETIFDDLFAALTSYRAGSPLSDDLTLIEITRVEFQNADETTDIDSNSVSGVESGFVWRVDFEWRAAGLREYDISHWVGEVLEQVPDLVSNRSRLHTAISEMIANAVDHGILHLDSRSKGGGQGFAAYYEQREKALLELRAGFVRVSMVFKRFREGREMVFRVTDSGAGFDHQQIGGSNMQESLLSGRGLMLARSLCADLRYNAAGNEVEGIFRW
ncbi:MAG: SpoIIE family protein phosphatase [Pseudomonadota bacterium]